VTRWLYIWRSYVELAGAGPSLGRYAGSWSYIQGSTGNHEIEWTTDDLSWMLYSEYALLRVCCTRSMLYSVYAVLGVCFTRCMLYSVYAVLGVCCTRCMLYSVHAVLGVCCTWCMRYLVYAVLGVHCSWCKLYSVYAALGVNSWSWHDEIEWDYLTFNSCDDGRVVDKKERDGG